MIFGIPKKQKQRRVHTEKYPNKAVLVIEPHTNGGRYTFRLNSLAISKLVLDDNNRKVTFAFDNDSVFIANANAVETTETSDVSKTPKPETKDFSFFNRDLYNYLVKNKYFDWDESEELELELKDSFDMPVYELVKLDIKPVDNDELMFENSILAEDDEENIDFFSDENIDNIFEN